MGKKSKRAEKFNLPLTTESERSERLEVRRTAKLYIGGAFPRSESGRSREVQLAKGGVANIAGGSRKDLREAVRVARIAAEPWAARTAMVRGQILYRVAELMEGRAAQFRDDLINHGSSKSDAAAEVSAAIDRMVWYAGWPDKLSAVLGGTNPVASSHFVFTLPEPTGVIASIAPEASPLLGLVSRLGGILAGGNVAIVLASESAPLPAVTLAEKLGTSPRGRAGCGRACRPCRASPARGEGSRRRL